MKRRVIESLFFGFCGPEELEYSYGIVDCRCLCSLACCAKKTND